MAVPTICVLLSLALTSTWAQVDNTQEPELTVRLVSGFTKYEGRVEVYWNGTWGTICDDLWDRNDAWVVCKQLGFGSPLQISNMAHFGSGLGPILLDNLECLGTEPDIFLCPHSGIGVHDCMHTEDAGVACSSPVPCASEPCGNGICVDSGETFHCICNPGYKGELCNEVVNCSLPSSPQPGAHFVSPQRSYSYNDMVVVACDDGPSFTTWSCNEHGQWDYHQLPCAALADSYRSTAVHSYTVIGIGSALVVIGVAVFVFVMFLLYKLKKRPHVEGLYEISSIPKDGTGPYLTMTGGNSPVLNSSRLSNSTQSSSTEPLIKCARANMALPPTPTERLRSASTMTSLLSVEGGSGADKGGDVEKASSPSHLTVPDTAPPLPVAPVRAKKPTNVRNPTHFKFPPLQNQSSSSSALKRLSAGNEGARKDGKVVNGRLTSHLDKRNHLVQQESTEDEEASLLYRNDEVVARHSHYNNEHERLASVASGSEVNAASPRVPTKQNTYEGI